MARAVVSDTRAGFGASAGGAHAVAPAGRGLKGVTVRYTQPSDGQLDRAVTLATIAGTGLSPAAIRAELAAGRMRPEWSVLAVREDGTIAGRALWWGREATVPIALDVWDVAPGEPDVPIVLGELMTHGHLSLTARGVAVPLPHTIRVPIGWKGVDAVRHDVEMKIEVAADAGLTRTNERLQFQWDAGTPVPTEPTRVTFSPADDETFVHLFARAAAGSLDVLTARELETSDAMALARAEVDFYRACPGERDWWRVARVQAGEVIGVAIPSATPTTRNVGYLAVLPEHRGQGHVDDLLAWITRFHARAGAPRITATTDAINTPMAAAFTRAGYRCTEIRIDLER